MQLPHPPFAPIEASDREKKKSLHQSLWVTVWGSKSKEYTHSWRSRGGRLSDPDFWYFSFLTRLSLGYMSRSPFFSLLVCDVWEPFFDPMLLWFTYDSCGVQLSQQKNGEKQNALLLSLLLPCIGMLLVTTYFFPSHTHSTIGCLRLPETKNERKFADQLPRTETNSIDCCSWEFLSATFSVSMSVCDPFFFSFASGSWTVCNK